MGVKVAQSCLQPLIRHVSSSSSPSHALAVLIPSPTSSSTKGTGRYAFGLSYHVVYRTDHRSPFLGASPPKVWRTRPLDGNGGNDWRKEQALTRAASASLDSTPDDDEEEEGEEEFIPRIRKLAVEANQRHGFESLFEAGGAEPASPGFYLSPVPLESSSSEPSQWLGIQPEPPDWPERNLIVPASVEWNANSVDLPLSLRMIKRKKRWEEIREAGEWACCSVKKAFSSMVFIVRELQCHALQMRQVLLYQDLQSILTRVQHELHDSFVWLFQQIFSCTPTFMVYLMILLANFTVYSMGHSPAIAAASAPNPPTLSAVMISHTDQHQQPRFDPLTVKTFSVGRAASVGGNGGGGGKVRPVAGATDDGRSEGSSSSSSIFDQARLGEGISTVPSNGNEEVGGGCEKVVTQEDERALWNRIVDEASRMQASLRHESLMDTELLQRFVSPVKVEVEPEDYYSDHFQTELVYQQALSQDPENTLLLSNFAQFLYLVLHDHDRAEYYFKRAVRIQPPDAEAFNRYAGFLWLVRKDLSAAEEAYLEAIAAEPNNTVYPANYAHFLWNTGGEDTCYPLDGPDA